VDISTVVTALVSSGVLSVGTARYLTGRFIDHRLAKDLRDHQELLDERLATSKASLDTRVATAKAEVEASLRKGVEEYLGEQAAERQYLADARKRLYTAIGPLRFQLVIASKELVSRVGNMGTGKQYGLSVSGYFGKSTIFRVLRIFAVCELIERQIAYADFSVDPSTVALLRFKHSAFRCMTSGKISLDHPRSNWNKQVEHVFHDVLAMVSAAMIIEGQNEEQARVMRFDEFSANISEPKWVDKIHPIPRLMENFSIETKPILWIRLVALAQLCSFLLAQEGPNVGIASESFNGVEMLSVSKDAFITSERERYKAMLDSLRAAIAPTIRAPIMAG
jgi:hypothetical protein